MTLKFNLMATIEVPNADKAPLRELLEESLVDLFEDEGMVVRKLRVTDYYAKQEGEE